MKKVRFFVMGYIVILLLSMMAVTTPQMPASIQSVRATGDSFYVVPVEDFGYAPMLKHLIDNAQTSVHVAMEEMSDNEPVKTILDALISAHNRGVDVDVLYEGDLSDNSNAANYLSSNGVNVKQDSTAKFLHAKLIVIDGEIVYLGSHNWSPNAFGENNEYGVIIYNKTVATFYDNYFNSLWNDDSVTPNLNPVNFQTTGYVVNTTYDGYTYNSLMSLMNSAQNRLYIAMYTMAYYSNPNNADEQKVDNMVNAIVAKKSIAKVVLDDHDSSDAYNYLSSNSVDVKYDSSGTITHLKLVIADNSVYIGDANWDTGYINNDTHTVGVVIENKTLAEYFASFFLKVYKYGDVPYYIPSPFVDNWQTSGPAGGYATLRIYIANGGYKNSTYFYLKPSGPLWMDMGRYPSWYRTSVYDWRNETLYIEIPSTATGTYTVALTFYSMNYDINYTMYFQVTVSGSGGSVPRDYDHPIITEVYYKDGSLYTKYRFVEIYNPTSNDIDLDGYKLVNVTSGQTYTIHGLKILAHSHVTIAVKAYYFAEKFHKYPDIGDGYQHNLEIPSNYGGIELREPDNTTVVDAVYWGGYNGWNINTDLYRSIVRVPYDWDNDSATQWVGSQEPKPWVQATADKVVLIDRGHDNDYLSKLGSLVVNLRKIGLNPENFTTTTGYHSNISADLLNTSYSPLAKLLIITNPNRALHTQEITNITNFVNNFNGSLLLTCKSDYNNGGKPENLNPVLQAMSSVIRFNDDGVYDDTNNYGASYKVIVNNFNDTSTGINTGVNQLYFYSPSSLIDSSGSKLTENEAIILATGNSTAYNKDNTAGETYVSYPQGSYPPVAAAQVVNQHRIATLGTTIFSDYDFYSADNSLFTENLIKWLLGIKSVSLGSPDLNFANSEHYNTSVVISVATANADTVKINYTSDGVNYVNDIMYDDGTHGDEKADDGTYSYTLPNFTAGTHIWGNITASGVDSEQKVSFSYYAMPDISWVRNNTGGVTVIIEGKVTAKPGSFYKAIYIQDTTAGIKVYGYDLTSLNLNYGDYVKVIGSTTTYRSDAEISISSVEKVMKTTSGTPVEPQVISIQQANSTNYGKLVQITGTVKYINATGHYFYVQDSNGNAVKVYNGSNIHPAISVGDTVQVTGVQGQYYSTYEILPREDADIVINPVPEFSGYLWIPMILAMLFVAYIFKKH